jgi:hypothetical protein
MADERFRALPAVEVLVERAGELWGDCSERAPLAASEGMTLELS